MSQTLPTPMPVGSGGDAAGVPRAGGGRRHRDSGGCGCTKCSLYRWYPPLLVLSSGMAGLFCWMYVTKPVFVGPRGPLDSGVVRPAVEDLETGAGQWEPSTADAATTLDPARGGLPGESPAGEMVKIVGGETDLEAGGFRPLVARAGGRGLFTPLPKEAGSGRDGAANPPPGAGEEGGTGAPGDAPGEMAADRQGEGPDGPLAEGTGEAPPVAGEGPEEAGAPADERDGWSGLEVGPSFMAEFLAGDGAVPGTGPGGGPEDGAKLR